MEKMYLEKYLISILGALKPSTKKLKNYIFYFWIRHVLPTFSRPCPDLDPIELSRNSLETPKELHMYIVKVSTFSHN